MYSFLIFIAFLIHVSLARVGLGICNNKSDCPESYFCQEKICKKCLRCDMLFRKGNSCISDFNDCEGCLEGYEEILVTDFSNAVKPCKPVKVKLKMCENDNSCPKNTYCNEDSCIKCFDCSLINRLPPAEKCAKGLNECGSCMIGYNEVAVTTDVNYKPCERDSLISSEVPNSKEIIFLIFFCVFIGFFVIFASVLTYRKWKDRSRSKLAYQGSVYPSAPPLCLLNSSNCISKVEEEESIIMGCVNEKTQQAKVFKQPDASYYWREGSNQLDIPSEGNNAETRPTSQWSSSDSGQPEETNCFPVNMRNQNFDLTLSESTVDSPMEQPNENSTEETGTLDMNSIFLELINIPQISENPNNEETDIMQEAQNSIQQT